MGDAADEEDDGGESTTTSDGFRITTRQRGVDEFTYDRESRWTGPFTFIQSADTQFGMIDDYVNKNRESPSVEPEIALTTRAIEAINAMSPAPRFMIVCGDLIDAMPGSKFRRGQIRAFKQTFARHLRPDIKLICVCGNHDLGNTPTVESVDAYRRDFGDDYFSFWVGGVKFVALNSQYFLDDSQTKTYRQEQDRWLDEVLNTTTTTSSNSSRSRQQEKWKHLIGFQHVPPFVSSPDEPVVPVEGSNPQLPFNIADLHERRQLLTKLRQSGMKKLFCGHYHRNAGGWDGDFEVIVTSAVGMQLGADVSGVRLVKVLENEVKHEYFPLDAIPKKVSIE